MISYNTRFQANGVIKAIQIFISLVSKSESFMPLRSSNCLNICRTISACEDIGLPFISDINSPKQPSLGCGKLSFTRDQDQRRHSTYHAFLPKDLALRRRHNLHIATNIIVEKIQIEQDNSISGHPHVARGVHLVTRTGSNSKPKRKAVGTRKEVILSAGPFGSPHVLMLSGIGPADHLKEHNIDIVKDLPAVGSNLVCSHHKEF